MTLEERMARQLEVAKRRLDDLGKEEVIWKQRLADAVLVLVAEGREITAETLRNRLLAMGEKVAKIAGTEISLEATRIASETAVRLRSRSSAASNPSGSSNEIGGTASDVERMRAEAIAYAYRRAMSTAEAAAWSF